MTTYYPIVIETEANGAVSAYVPGLPVYAPADTRQEAERAIRTTLCLLISTRIRTALRRPVFVRVAVSPTGHGRKWSSWASGRCWARNGAG